VPRGVPRRSATAGIGGLGNGGCHRRVACGNEQHVTTTRREGPDGQTFRVDVWQLARA
jgi:hypothetical protein